MTKTLLLLRHAKSDQTRSPLDDFTRPLNARGQKAALRMGAYLKEAGLKPDFVLCSAALRATETWERALKGLGDKNIKTKKLRSLYLASPGRILDVLKRVPDEANTVLVIAHNPGMARLAFRLAGKDSKPKALARMRVKYPTAGLAEIRFACKCWADVEVPDAGRLIRFVIPKEL
ncbi:MAG: SixA phosphatase family protein [Alphaproteobacteria bacterium]